MKRSRTLMALLCMTFVSGCSGNAPKSDPATKSAATDGATTPGARVTLSDSDSGLHSLMQFRDVAGDSGVEFTYRNGEEAGNFSILESLGGGAALFDSDNDGDLDLFLPGGGEFQADHAIRGRPGALFRQQGRWRFENSTTAARADSSPYYSHGTAAADFDNDGFADLLVTGYGGLLLLHNQGDGTFETVTEAAGLSSDDLWSSSAAWGDFNGDGNLDLYVAHYVNWSFENHPFCQGPQPGQREVCPPREFDPLPDYLYVSVGDGSFQESSQAAGLATSGPDAGKGLGVFVADIDDDGDVDIYVGNDTVPNFLYRNRGDGSFEDVSLISGTSLSEKGVAEGSMGVDLGDFDLDGLPDIWVANYERESFGLYHNEGDCFFRPVSQSAGVTAVGALFVGWGTVFADFDLDADEDIFVSNGHVIRYATNAPLLQEPLLFQNESGRRLVNVSHEAGPYLQTPHMGRGVAAGDIDDDGDIDLVVTHTNQPASLLENTQTSEHHSVKLRLIGKNSNRDAIGARIRLESSSGVQVRQVKGGASYASTHDHRIMFGVREDRNVDAVTVRWPSGATRNLRKFDSDTSWIAVEDQGFLTAGAQDR